MGTPPERASRALPTEGYDLGHDALVRAVAGRVEPPPHPIFPVAPYLPTFLRRVRWWVAGQRLGRRLPALRPSPWATAAVGALAGFHAALVFAIVGYGRPPTLDSGVLAVISVVVGCVLVLVARPRPPDEIATWDALERALDGGPEAVREIDARSVGAAHFLLVLGLLGGALSGGLWWGAQNQRSRGAAVDAIAASPTSAVRKWVDRAPGARSAVFDRLLASLADEPDAAESERLLRVYSFAGPPRKEEAARLVDAVRAGRVDSADLALLVGLHEVNAWYDDDLVRAALETRDGWLPVTRATGARRDRIDRLIADALPFPQHERTLLKLLGLRGEIRVPEPIRSRLSAEDVARLERLLDHFRRVGADR